MLLTRQAATAYDTRIKKLQTEISLIRLSCQTNASGQLAIKTFLLTLFVLLLIRNLAQQHRQRKPVQTWKK
jgi:hypothetical protein